MRLPLAILSSAAALGFAAAANADFTGWSTQLITLGNGHTIMNVYANFNNVGDRVVNVYRANITTNVAGGFFQSAANPFWKPGTENKATSDDSWVTVDTNPNGNGNASGSITAGDPNFLNFDDLNGDSDFSFISGGGNGAGWYNAQPGTQWGYADGGQVLVAHFVAASLTEGNGPLVVHWNASLTITRPGISGSQSDVGVGDQTFGWVIPGPGALALLGVAGLASRRRRA